MFDCTNSCHICWEDFLTAWATYFGCCNKCNTPSSSFFWFPQQIIPYFAIIQNKRCTRSNTHSCYIFGFLLLTEFRRKNFRPWPRKCVSETSGRPSQDAGSGEPSTLPIGVMEDRSHENLVAYCAEAVGAGDSNWILRGSNFMGNRGYQTTSKINSESLRQTDWYLTFISKEPWILKGVLNGEAETYSREENTESNCEILMQISWNRQR